MNNKTFSFRHIIALFLTLTNIIALPLQSSITNQKPAIMNQRKHITIFYCKGGGGHISAARALSSFLEKDYNVSIVNIIDEVLYPLDFVRNYTFNWMQSEDLYNVCLARNWLKTANSLTKIGKHAIKAKRKNINKILLNYIKKHPTNFFISTLPLFNGSILDVAEKINIPFLLVTTDLDVQNYTLGLEKRALSDRFRMTLAFKDDLLLEALTKVRLKENQLIISGLALRKDFMEKKDKATIKKEWDIPENKKIIMLLMGAAGSQSCLKYAQELLSLKRNAHVLICTGRNEALAKKISKLKPKYNSLTFSTIGFTSRISDLLALSDILITKPGPNSICEAIQLQVPLILDETSGLLYWEKYNLAIVEKYGIGTTIKQLNNLKTVVSTFLDNNTLAAEIRIKMALLAKNNFELATSMAITEMLALKPAVMR